MTRVTIKSSINNEVRLGIESDTRPKYAGDKIEKRRSTMYAERIAEIQSISAMVASAEMRSVGFSTTQTCEAMQTCLFGEPEPINPEEKIIENFKAVVNVVTIAADASAVVEEVSVSTLIRQREELRALTLSKNFNAHPKPKWGRDFAPKQFTRRARHTILEAGAWLDREYGIGKICEITLTLPGDTDEAFRALAQWSGWMVNRLKQVIRRRSDNADIHHFFAWEFQKRGALHMHWALAHPDPLTAYCLSEQIKDHWYDLLIELGERIGINFFLNTNGRDWRSTPSAWQWRVVPIRKSVAAYYSKYLSKSAAAINKKRRWKSASIYYPSRWWGMDRKLNQEIKKCRVSIELGYLPPKIASTISQNLKMNLKSLSPFTSQYQYQYIARNPGSEIVYGGGEIAIGFVPSSKLIEVQAYLRSLKSTIWNFRFGLQSLSLPSEQHTHARLVGEFFLALSSSTPSEVADFSAIMSALPSPAQTCEFCLEWMDAMQRRHDCRDAAISA